MTGQESARPADNEANRYSRRNILRSESMYGHGFQSPGGLEAVEGFCRNLQMRQGMNILEIGSGLGGSAFYFARQYAATVVGLDISKEMVEITNERKNVLGLSSVSFQQGDIRTASLEKDHFDLAWTRDCVLYIKEKSTVWKNVHAALKRGGQLFVTDFSKGKAPISEAKEEMVTVIFPPHPGGSPPGSITLRGLPALLTESSPDPGAPEICANQLSSSNGIANDSELECRPANALTFIVGKKNGNVGQILGAD